MVIIEELIKAEKAISIINDFISCNEYLLPDPFSAHVDIRQYAEKLNRLGTTFIAKDNEEVVGLLSGYINDFGNKCAYMQIGIVSKRLQGKGIGTQLFRTFIEKTKDVYGGGTVFLTVDKCNVNAFRLYTNMGFIVSNKAHLNENKMIMEYKLE